MARKNFPVPITESVAEKKQKKILTAVGFGNKLTENLTKVCEAELR